MGVSRGVISRHQDVDRSDSGSDDFLPSPEGLKTIYSGISVSFTTRAGQPTKTRELSYSNSLYLRWINSGDRGMEAGFDQAAGPRLLHCGISYSRRSSRVSCPEEHEGWGTITGDQCQSLFNCGDSESLCPYSHCCVVQLNLDMDRPGYQEDATLA